MGQLRPRIDEGSSIRSIEKGPSLESIHQKAANILTRLESIEDSVHYLASGPQPIDEDSKGMTASNDTNIPEIEELLARSQGMLVSIENNLSKLRYG